MMVRLLPMLALATALSAQIPPPNPILEPIKSYLNLQDSQLQALQQLRQQQMQSIESALKELAAKQQSLREQLDRGSTDAAALGKLLLETEALRKRIRQTHESFRAQAVNLLTPEQRTKLTALEEALKLGPAAQTAAALGLLTPPEPAPGEPAPGLFGFGRGVGPAGARPMMAPGGRAGGAQAGPMRSRFPRSSPLHEQ